MLNDSFNIRFPLKIKSILIERSFRSEIVVDNCSNGVSFGLNHVEASGSNFGSLDKLDPFIRELSKA